jgi:hypothetical protein
MNIMRKIIILLFISIFFIFLYANSTFACSLVRPYIQINIDDKECKIYRNYTEPAYQYPISIDTVNEKNINNACPTLKLSNDDKTIILEFIKQFRTDLKFPNYIYITHQSADQYANFLKETKKTNSKICSCSKIKPKERVGNWTVYIHTFKDSCSFSTACFQPPFFCPNSMYFILLLICVGIGIVVIISVIVIIKIVKKRKK